jgi:hypothetical protein
MDETLNDGAVHVRVLIALEEHLQNDFASSGAFGHALVRSAGFLSVILANRPTAPKACHCIPGRPQPVGQTRMSAP